MDSPEQGCNNAFLCTKPHVPLRQLPQLKEEEPMGYKAIAAEEVEMAAAVAVAEEDELPCNSWHEFANQRESNTNNIWNIQLFSSMTVSLIQDLSKTVVSKNKPQTRESTHQQLEEQDATTDKEWERQQQQQQPCAGAHKKREEEEATLSHRPWAVPTCTEEAEASHDALLSDATDGCQCRRFSHSGTRIASCFARDVSSWKKEKKKKKNHDEEKKKLHLSFWFSFSKWRLT